MKKIFYLLLFILPFTICSCGGEEDEPIIENNDPQPEVKKDIISFTANGVSFNMILVEGGKFKMGSIEYYNVWDNEKPAHNVSLSDFYIGETEVTQKLWKAVMGKNPSHFLGYDQRPVEQVSWDDCQEFINKLNIITGKQFRLPTEAQWEFAALGGNKSQNWNYSGSNDINEVAWYYSNSAKTTNPVGSKKANELGIYDMSGNVFEWCQDYYGLYSEEDQTNPTGPASGEERITRGGCFIDGQGCCRVKYRLAYFNPTSKDEYLGLRLAL